MHKVNFRLINNLVIVLTIFLIYKSFGLWIGIMKILNKIFMPFILAFILAYAISPMVDYLRRKKIPKGIAILIVIMIIISFLLSIILLLFPLLIKEGNILFTEITLFIQYLQNKFSINTNFLEDIVANCFNANIYKYVTNITINFVSILFSYFSTFAIFITVSIYFLIEMDDIKNKIKKIEHNKIITLLRKIDRELKKYFKSFFAIMIITFFEYTISFYIIKHPNFLLLGFLYSFASIIPFFGGIIVNILSAITAFVIEFRLFLRTLILFCILSLIDSNVINPIVYGKTNKINPIITIFSSFVCGILFNLVGIIIALPLTIVILTIYHFFKSDICDKIKEKWRKKYDPKT